MVCGKGSGVGAARDGGQNRRIHFQIAVIIFQYIFDSVDDFGTHNKRIPDFRVYDKIDVSLPVSGILILQSMPFARQDLEGF
ncbi:hypothetical protein SDC9_184371 [bioreactor metagenome]|uniref:Uncharacterized protein n=1 Tax=bioreactor metagenome TaxID=1076179 RepID=A0A645HFB8_9ZZZZ